MAIQPFATQIQAPQIQTPNPINQMGQLMALRDSQQQNQLRGMQMGQLRREEADVNTLRGFDPTSPTYIDDVTRIDPKLGIDLRTKQREAQKFELETKVKGQEFITARLTAFQDRLKQALTPADRLAAHRAIHADADLGPYLASMGATAESGETQIIEAARSPETWNAFVVASNGGLEKLLEYNAKQADELRKQSGENRAVAGEARAVLKAAEDSLAAKNASDPDFQQKMENARVLGRDIAQNDVKALQALPVAAQTAQQAISLIDEMVGQRDDKGELVAESKPHPGFDTAVGRGIYADTYAKIVPGSDTANFVNRLQQIQGSAFLQAYETLKGGGPIAIVEGEKATVAINRMSTAQSKKEFIAASNDFKNALQRGLTAANERLAAARSRTSGSGAPPAAPAPASSARSFATVAEAEAANLPPDTKITIGGRPATVQ